MSTPGNQEFHEVLLTSPTRGNINNHRHEIISTAPSINSVHYGQRMSPILPVAPVANNENVTNNEVYNYYKTSSADQRPSLQNINDRENFKNEILQVFNSNTNDLVNFKNEILQAVRQEIMQNLRQDTTQYGDNVSNANINK